MEVLFNNFKRQYAVLKGEVDAAIKETLESGNFILGDKVKKFEEKFAEYLGVEYCVGVANGTDAITLSLMALGIGEGDEVITTDLTAFPTVAAILRAKAIPVLVDINEKDGLIDVEKIEKKITAKTKAITPVHLYGQSADLKRIGEIATKHNLKIIEDCAQSTGATFGNKKTGTMGICGAFSFYPTKNLGAYGDGGAVVTNDKAVYEKLLSLRIYGRGWGYDHEREGLNSRLDEMQAAILLAKLPHLEKWNQRRREIAAYYRENIKTVECLEENSYGKAVFHLFVVKCERRDELKEYLKKNGVETLIHYPSPMQRQSVLNIKNSGLEESDKFAGQILSLPMYPELTDEEVEYVVKIVNSFK
jgi:dTDP-4-amino-4,6-dideoxygalactose transaminase